MKYNLNMMKQVNTNIQKMVYLHSNTKQLRNAQDINVENLKFCLHIEYV